MIDVPRQKVVPQFMSDAETLEAFVLEMARIRDGERVAQPDQHAGYANVCRLRHDVDLTISRDGERIDGERVEPQLVKNAFCFVCLQVKFPPHRSLLASCPDSLGSCLFARPPLRNGRSFGR